MTTAVSPAPAAAVVVRWHWPSSGQPNRLSCFGGYATVIRLRRLLLKALMVVAGGKTVTAAPIAAADGWRYTRS